MQFQYPFTDSLNNHFSLLVSQIPTITVESGFAWDNFLTTIFGSLIAGLIPAFIAWKTIKSNVDTLRLQIRLNDAGKSIELLKDLCARYCAEVEVMLSEFSTEMMKVKNIPGYGQEHLQAFSIKQFEFAKSMNVYTNKVFLNINQENEFSEKIEVYFKEIETSAKEFMAVDVSSDESNLIHENFINSISNLLLSVKSYVKKENELYMQ